MKRTSAPDFRSGKRQKAKPFKKQSPSTQQIRRIARVLGVEDKYFDVAINFASPATADWSATEVGADMPQLVQGDDIGNRNGRKVQLKRVMFRGNVLTSAMTGLTNVEGPSTTRCVLVLNKQPNGTSMNGEDVMGLNGGAAATALVAIGMFQSTVSFGRAKIVDDVTVHNDVTAAANNASATTLSCVAKENSVVLSYRPKKPLIIEYAAAATAIPNTNSFNILVNSDAVSFTPTLQGVMRFYFTDV